jgi:hypothetical protein
MIKLRRMRRAELVARMEEIRNAYNLLLLESEGKKCTYLLRDLDLDGRT